MKTVRHIHKHLSASQKRLYATTNSVGRRPTVALFGGSIENPLSFHVMNQLIPHVSVRVQAEKPDQFKREMLTRGFEEQSAEIFEGTITNVYSIEQILQGVDYVVNVDQLLFESDRTYIDVYINGVSKIGTLAARYGVKKYVQCSVLGAELEHKSRYLDVNYRAEDMAYAAFPDVTIVRPNFATFGDKRAVIDMFRSRLLPKLSPIIPYPYDAKRLKIQPVHINDVATAISKVILQMNMPGKIIQLCGANTYEFPELLKKVFGPKILMPAPSAFIHFWYAFAQFLSTAVVSRDMIPMICRRMVRDDDEYVFDLVENANLPEDPVQRKRMATFKDLDIEPVGF
jgi:uncharacterized protein YbjT (DUF2867 family)